MLPFIFPSWCWWVFNLFQCLAMRKWRQVLSSISFSNHRYTCPVLFIFHVPGSLASQSPVIFLQDRKEAVTQDRPDRSQHLLCLLVFKRKLLENSMATYTAASNLHSLTKKNYRQTFNSAKYLKIWKRSEERFLKVSLTTGKRWTLPTVNRESTSCIYVACCVVA